MNIVVTGASLTGNKGASAMCISVINALKNKYGSDINIGLLSPKPDLDVDMANDLNVRLFSYGGILRKSIPNHIFYTLFKKPIFDNDSVYDSYKWADLIIDIHGINFSDSDSLVSTAIIPSAQIYLAHLLGVPIVKFTQSFGPMHRLTIKLFAKLFLSLVSNIFPREKMAHESLKSIGLKNLEPVTVDSAFLLSPEYPQALKQIKQSSIKRVAFIPNAILLSKSVNYMEVCSKLISMIISEGYKPVIIMHYSKPSSDEALLDKSSNNDYKLIQELLKRISKDDKKNIEVYAEEYSSNELKGIIGSCELAVPSRYHALVGAISQAIPSFCVGWAGKYEGLLDRVGLKQYSFCTDRKGCFDVNYILENFKIFLESYSSGKLDIYSDVVQLRTECGESYDRLFQIIDSYGQ